MRATWPTRSRCWLRLSSAAVSVLTIASIPGKTTTERCMCRLIGRFIHLFSSSVAVGLFSNSCVARLIGSCDFVSALTRKRWAGPLICSDRREWAVPVRRETGPGDLVERRLRRERLLVAGPADCDESGEFLRSLARVRGGRQ